MGDDDQEAGHVLGAEHSDEVDEQAMRRIIDAACAGDTESLHNALKDASPDERSAAAKELAGKDDRGELNALHQGLQDLGIGPS